MEDKQINGFMNKLDILSSQFNNFSDMLNNLIAQMNSMTTQMNSFAQRLDTLTDRIDAFADRVDSLTERVDTLADRVDSLTERVDTLTNRVDSLTERVDTLTDRVDSLTERVDTLTERVDTLTEHVDTLTDRVDSMEEQIHILQMDMINLDIKFDKKITKLTKGYKTLSKRIDHLNIRLTGELTFVKDDINDIKYRLGILEDKIELNNNQHAAIVTLLDKRYFENTKDIKNIYNDVNTLQTLAQKNELKHREYDQILNIEHI